MIGYIKEGYFRKYMWNVSLTQQLSSNSKDVYNKTPPHSPLPPFTWRPSGHPHLGSWYSFTSHVDLIESSSVLNNCQH